MHNLNHIKYNIMNYYLYQMNKAPSLRNMPANIYYNNTIVYYLIVISVNYLGSVGKCL